jgi:His-Xaa-Ser system radical SAM maturase HxsB
MKKYRENTYRHARIGDIVLLTTDHGSWTTVDDRQFGLLRDGRPEEEAALFSKLNDAGIIITDENEDSVIRKLREKYVFLCSGTSLHIVIPTLRCNQKCLYCHASSKPADRTEFDMDEKTAKATVDFIFQSPSRDKTIEFQGGEPLLNFDIVKYIVEYSKAVNVREKSNLRFTLVTNLTCMDDAKLEFLISNGVSICTSLDGPEWLHNKNRPFPGQGGSFSHANSWISRIREEYEKRNIVATRMNALITVTRHSLGHHKEIIDEYVGLGLTDIFFRFLNNLGDARSTWNTISYSAEEFIDFWKKSMDYIIELNMSGKTIREWFAWVLLQKILLGIEPSYFEQRSPCGAVIGQMAYNYNGDIYTCDEGRMVSSDLFKIGNVIGGNYKDIVGSNQSCCIVASSVNDVQVCDSCAFKPFCGICPVCNYAEQGSIIGNILASSRCKIYMAQFNYIFDKILNDKDALEVFNRWLSIR